MRRIKALDPDQYQDLNDFIGKSARLPQKEIIYKIMEKYGCSHVTALRKLRSHHKTRLAEPKCETSRIDV